MTPTPEGIFRYASAFHFASGVLQDHIMQRFVMSEVSGAAFTTPVGPPWAVLTALATELYLKALVMLESGNYPRIHELQDLYRRVSLAKQKRIKEFFNEVFIRPAYKAILRDKGKTVDPQEFEVQGALRRLNNTFVEYRYSFEGGNDETSIGERGSVWRCNANDTGNQT
jgi:hypothetical protein